MESFVDSARDIDAMKRRREGRAARDRGRCSCFCELNARNGRQAGGEKGTSAAGQDDAYSTDGSFNPPKNKLGLLFD